MSASKGNYQKWNSLLDRFWCELAGDVKKDGDEDKEFFKLNLKVGEYGKLSSAGNKIGFQEVNKEAKENVAKQYAALTNKELFLRRLQHTQGKGTSYEDPESEDM